MKHQRHAPPGATYFSGRSDRVLQFRFRNIASALWCLVFAVIVYFNVMFGWFPWRALPLVAGGGAVALYGLWRLFPPDTRVSTLTRNANKALIGVALALCLATAAFTVAHAQAMPSRTQFGTLTQLLKGSASVTGEELNADNCTIRASIDGDAWEFAYIAGDPSCVLIAFRDAQSGNVWTGASDTEPPSGSVDDVDWYGYVQGWTATAGRTVVGVRMQIDGDTIGGTMTTDERPDVPAVFPQYPSGAGWHWQVPARYGDWQWHELRVFAADEAGNESELWGSPHWFQFWTNASIPFTGSFDALTPTGQLIGWAGNFTGDPARVIITVDDDTYGNNGANYSSAAGNHISTGDARPDVAAVFPQLGPNTGWHIGFPFGMATGVPRKVRAWSIDSNNKPRQLWNSPMYVSCQPIDYVRMYCVQVSPFAAAFGADARPDVELKAFDNGSGVEFTWSNCDPNLSQCQAVRSATAQGAIDLAIASGNAHPSILDGPRAQCSGLKPVVLFGPPANPIVYYSQNAALAVDAVYPAARNIALHTCGIGDGVGAFHYVRCGSQESATTHGRAWVHVDNITGLVPEERLCPPPSNCKTVAKLYGAGCGVVAAGSTAICNALSKRDRRAGIACAVGGAVLDGACTITKPDCD